MVVSSVHSKPMRTGMLLVTCLLAAALPGCKDFLDMGDSMAFWHHPETKYVAESLPEDTVTLASDGLRHEPPTDIFGGDFGKAKQLFSEKKYKEAEVIFGYIADSKKNLLQIQEAARYYQAECFFKMGQYPAAGDNYIALLDSFPSAAHGDTVRKRMFDIANYWLDETRDQMEESRAVQEGKASWMAATLASMRMYPWSIRIHFADSQPLFDMEGHAVRLLEKVYMTSPRGELSEKSLFMLASVMFYREKYKDADEYFYRLVQNFPNSSHAAKAMELSIVCKQICTGGPEYDGRRLQEARDLIKMAERTYPELAKGQEQFLAKQKIVIHEEEAERDFGMAGFYERTGHPGSAYFYYEIVKRRYPGTEFAAKSEKKIVELEAAAAKEVNQPAPTFFSPALLGPLAPDMTPPPRSLPASVTSK
jgi:outer membrane protein assembly factor BamD (BamD/ComL family)